jgi:hypothetical protein
MAGVVGAPLYLGYEGGNAELDGEKGGLDFVRFSPAMPPAPEYPRILVKHGSVQVKVYRMNQKTTAGRGAACGIHHR